MKVVLVTGGFDPLHSGHIAFFEEAKKLGDILVVGINSDAWLARKKGRSFMPFSERSTIIRALKCVDEIVEYDDDDNSSKQAIVKCRENWPDSTIIFANGGDRTKENIPEMDVNVQNVEFVFSVGGANKKNSSSWILDEWKSPKTPRNWGYYRVLYELPGVKVKELVVDPGQSLSMQKHEHRNEHWHVVQGEGSVKTKIIRSYETEEWQQSLFKDSTINIRAGLWHQLSNTGQEKLHLIEIQYGTECTEDDIEREIY